MHTFTKAALAFARVAADAGSSDSERATALAKLTAYCAANGVTIADAAAAVQADSFTASQKLRNARAPKASPDIDAAKRANADTASKPGNTAKPEPKAKPEQPAKPSKPADESKAADYAARVALIAELRNAVSAIYNGPSLAIRTNPKRFNLAVYSDLLAAPKHRTTTDRVSTRDISALCEIIKRGDASGAFDPSLINLDAGIFSRLASIAYIEAAPTSSKLPFRLSKLGAEAARIASKRAA